MSAGFPISGLTGLPGVFTASGPDELFRYAVQAMHDALYVLDASGHILFCNTSAERRFGTGPDAYGRPLFAHPWSLLNEDGSPNADGALPSARALKTGVPYQGTFGIGGCQREMRWVVATIVPFRRPDENLFTLVLVTLRDITDERRHRDALIQREAYYRSLIENSYDIITVLDHQGTICFESPSIERVLGYSPTELIGRKAFDYVHPADRPRVLAAFQNRIQNPKMKQATVYRALHKNGGWIAFETVSTFVESESQRTRIILNSREVIPPNTAK